MMSLYESLFQSVPGAGMLLGGAHHRGRKPAHGIGRGRSRVARGHRGGLAFPDRVGLAHRASPGAPAGSRRARASPGAAAGSRPSRAPSRSGPYAALSDISRVRPRAIGHRPASRRPSATERAPCLHRHRLEHDAAARRGLRRRPAARGPPGAGVHPRAAGTDHERGDRGREDRRGGRGGRRASFGAARELGASEIRGVATAAVRRAVNRDDAPVGSPGARAGSRSTILSAEEEARLAFSGAARTLGYDPAGPLGVVDVGGGSCELVVGDGARSGRAGTPRSELGLGPARRRVPAVRSAVGRGASGGPARGCARCSTASSPRRRRAWSPSAAAPHRCARIAGPAARPRRVHPGAGPAGRRRARSRWRAGSRSTRTACGCCRPAC